MPWNSNPTMQALRLTYNAAVAAHAACSRALMEATLCGGQASPELIEAEAKAKALLAETRARLHNAMALAMAQGGTTDSELPNP
jgi:dihydroxyacid dehydratase/phosphogluconate dehydratase